ALGRPAARALAYGDRHPGHRRHARPEPVRGLGARGGREADHRRPRRLDLATARPLSRHPASTGSHRRIPPRTNRSANRTGAVAFPPTCLDWTVGPPYFWLRIAVSDPF